MISPVFHSMFGPVKNRRSKVAADCMAVSAATLRPAVCITMSSTRRTSVAKVANTSRAKLFLLFIVEERISMAAPLGAPNRTPPPPPHTHTRTHAPTHARTHARTHTHTHTHTHTRTHTHESLPVEQTCDVSFTLAVLVLFVLHWLSAVCVRAYVRVCACVRACACVHVFVSACVRACVCSCVRLACVRVCE